MSSLHHHLPTLALASFAILVTACDEGGIVATPPFLSVSAENIDFGDRVIGTQEERTVFLINKGSTPLSLMAPIGDTRNGVFAVLLDGFTVPPNSDVVARIVFSPADPEVYTSTITLRNGSTNRPELLLSLRGRGIQPGPCDGISCREAPPPTCVNERTTRRYEPLGTCVEGRCEHAYQDDECEFGCDDTTGACRGDPCIGMACTTPPNNCYFANGTCERGACRFEVNNAGVCDDGQACTTQDHCTEGTCVGVPTVCDAPPAPTCVDATHRRVWNPQGVCNTANGGCEYTSQDQFCEFGCAPEGCIGDPCAGISCDTPPNTQCWAPAGTCSNGICTYTPVAGPCDDGDPCTTGDTCNAGTCQGTPLVCNTPPAAECVDSATRRVYNSVGTCTAGQCQYASTTASCDDSNACTTGDQCTGAGVCQSLGSLGCSDANACTTDRCDPVAGCVFAPSSGNACTTGSSECPTGTCSAGQCLATPNVTCVTEIQVDLCQDAEVAGLCSASGECVISSAPPALTCPGCNGICLQCFIIQVCIPFGP